ncbi:hypothetical protein GGX14DRAFT_568008 [Mycena pura]|uniref:Uncharacterized protein n=1 Tax=Mycena pura TaxID=153505 RepID=A0AAD6VA01_9AGAR|nr:hypothetical protein GGX14DRAFT_568008 [Mycena pura]
MQPAPMPTFLPPPPPAREAVVALTFLLQRRDPTILNCTVVGADGCTPYLHIMTAIADARPARTVFRTNAGRTVAAVDWSGAGAAAARVEIDQAVARQLVSEWLGVSTDPRYRMRIMHAYGQQYVWVPQETSICIQMYHYSTAADQQAPRLLARVEQVRGKITLEIAVEAVNRR